MEGKKAASATTEYSSQSLPLNQLLQNKRFGVLLNIRVGYAWSYASPGLCSKIDRAVGGAGVGCGATFLTLPAAGKVLTYFYFLQSHILISILILWCWKLNNLAVC